MIATKDLFTFELDLGSGKECIPEERLEDIVFNCLDFCLLYGRTAHFFLRGADPARSPAVWQLLELLRREDASFSLLSEPENTAFGQSRLIMAELEKVEIACDGVTRRGSAVIGNIFEDRLADLWFTKGFGRCGV